MSDLKEMATSALRKGALRHRIIWGEDTPGTTIYDRMWVVCLTGTRMKDGVEQGIIGFEALSGIAENGWELRQTFVTFIRLLKRPRARAENTVALRDIWNGREHTLVILQQGCSADGDVVIALHWHPRLTLEGAILLLHDSADAIPQTN
ncbi:MAG: hypothetical protein AAB562_03525 [Patescibacteria group bacterium]